VIGKPVVPRAQARRDVDDAIDHYRAEAGETIARGFVEAVVNTYRAIASRPAAGSSRHAYELGLPRLRSRRLGRYPYLAFYVEGPEYIEVWRVLHMRRDIPAAMQDPE